MAQFTGARRVLAVPDLAASAVYARDQLGFEVDSDVLGCGFLSRGSFAVMWGECPAALPAPQNRDHAHAAYVTVKCAWGLPEDCVARRLAQCKPLRDETWGMREFGVLTLDGHRIIFGEPLQ